MSKERTLKILSIAISIAVVTAAVAFLRARPACDEAQLQAALSEIDDTSPALRATKAAGAIATHCPRPGSKFMEAHLLYLATYFDEHPIMLPSGLLGEPEEKELWDELCPGGPNLEELPLNVDARRSIHDICELDRLAVLTPDEGRQISQYTVRTWLFYPWLLHHRVSSDTARRLLRSLLLWPWQKRCSVLEGADLPVAAGSPFPPLDSPSDIVVLHGNEIHDCIHPITRLTDKDWRQKLLADCICPYHYRVYSSASDPAMAIALIAQTLNGQDYTLSIVVATDEAYQPYVELPIEFSATPSEGHVAVSSEMTVQELVSAVSLRMGQPCCGEQDGTPCPQTCKQERIRISLAPRQ